MIAKKQLSTKGGLNGLEIYYPVEGRFVHLFRVLIEIYKTK